MASHQSRRVIRTVVLGVWGLTVGPAWAQESKSAGPGKELASLMQQSGQQYIAAAVPGSENTFVAALALPGTLLVVSADYSAPRFLNDFLEKKSYQDIYQELQSASVRETKVFVSDLGADGLRARPGDGQPFDSYTTDEARVMFDGDWRRQKLSEEDYQKQFAAADEKYSGMLSLLVQALKKPS